MPREQDTSTVISIDFENDPGSKGGRTSAQNEQLERARNKALYNRRVKLKAKLEQRLSELRAKLPDLRSDQLERVVKHLVETEDHHRGKLNDLTEMMNKRLQSIFDELHAIRKGHHTETKHRASGGSSVAALSDVSTLRR